MDGEYLKESQFSYTPNGSGGTNKPIRTKRRFLWIGIPIGIVLVGLAVYFILFGGGRGLFQASVFNTSSIFGTSADNVPGQANLLNPTDTALDDVNHLLYVVDTGNHRIVVHKLDQNNEFIDKAIDGVIGQIDLISVGPRASGVTSAFVTSDLGLLSPQGIYYENNVLYVADTGNNRVLIYDFDQIFGAGVVPFSITLPYAYVGATGVIGQSHLRDATNPPGLSANKLSAPTAVYVFDEIVNGVSKKMLLVADTGNNRVLGFDVRPTNSPAQVVCGTVSTTGYFGSMGASCVIGQSSFTDGGVGSGEYGLSGPKGVIGWGDVVLVSDTGNNRILGFDARFPGSIPRSLCGSLHQPTGLGIGDPALCVFGQSDFSSTSAGVGAFALNGPTDIAIDAFVSGFPGSLPGNKRIFVADTGNHRVVTFDATFGGANGMSAWSVLGQDTYTGTSASSGIVGAHFNAPMGVMYGGAIGRRLFIANSGNDRIDAFRLVDAGMQTATTVHQLPSVMYSGTVYRTSLAPFIQHAQGTVTHEIIMEHDPSIANPPTNSLSQSLGPAGTSGLSIDPNTGELTGILRYTSTPSDTRYVFLIRTTDTIPGTDVRFYDTAVYRLYVEQPPQSPTCSVYFNNDPAITSLTLGGSNPDSATLTWASTNAESVVVTPGTGIASSAVNGSTTIAPTTDTTYTFTFTGFADLSPETGHRDQQVTEVVSCSVTVLREDTPPPQVLSCSLSVDTNVIAGSETATLTWGSQNATSAALSDSVTPETGTLFSGTAEVAPDVTTTYTYTVSDASGNTETCSTRVAVRAPTRCNFTTTDVAIEKGNSTTIAWTSVGGRSASMSPDVTLASGTILVGSASVSPTSDTTYVLSVVDPAGEIYQCSTNVTVDEGGCTGNCGSDYPPKCSLDASRKSIRAGEPVTFTWKQTKSSAVHGGEIIATFSDELVPAKDVNPIYGDAFDGAGVVFPQVDTTYTLTYKNDDGVSTCRETVRVQQDRQVFDCNVTGDRNNIDEDGNGQTDIEQCPIEITPQDCNVTGIKNNIDEDGNGQTDTEQCPVDNPVARCPYFTKYVKLGANNDPFEVNLIKHFLTTYEGEDLSAMGGYNGIYTVATDNAVRRFQAKYTGQVLVPWMDPDETWWYKTTRIMANWLMDCKETPKYLEDDISPLPSGGGYIYDFDYSGACSVRPGYAAEQNVTRVFGEEIPYCTYIPNYCNRSGIPNACEKPKNLP